MRAILINPYNRTVTEIDLSPGLDNIYKAMSTEEVIVDMIEVGVAFRNSDVMYVDERGALKQESKAFRMKDTSQVLFGTGLVVGTDDDGNDVDCLCAIEDDQIGWIS